ncbi:hypothetical protein [Moraxella lacunata]
MSRLYNWVNDRLANLIRGNYENFSKQMANRLAVATCHNRPS